MAIDQLKNKIAYYGFSSWNPSDLSATYTKPSGTTDSTLDNDYVSFSNSSGVLTTTFNTTGKYKMELMYTFAASNVYTYSTNYWQLGTFPTNSYYNVIANFGDTWAPSEYNGNYTTTSYIVFDASATETAAVTPWFRVFGGSSTSSFTGKASVTVSYLGE